MMSSQALNQLHDMIGGAVAGDQLPPRLKSPRFSNQMARASSPPRRATTTTSSW